MNRASQLWQRIETNGTYPTFFLVFVLSFAVRLALIVLLKPYHDLARFELERTALSLAQSGVYGNPYAIPTGPSAHVSPGYTVLLAGLFYFFGTGTAAEILKEVFASFVSAVGCAFIPLAAQAFSMSRRIGLIAGFLTGLLPIKPLVQIDGDWDATYTALFLVILSFVVVKAWRNHNFSYSGAVKRGLLWGVTLLFASVLLPVFVIVLLAGAFFARPISLRSYLRAAAVEAILALVCLSPWVIRNSLALASPIATRSNFGIELYVSNNDEATPDQRLNYIRKVYDHFHPLQNELEAEKVRDMGEVAYNKSVLATTREWIREHPKRFLELCAGRFACFWFYPDASRAKAVFGDLTAILGFAGLYFLYQAEREPAIWISILFLFYAAPSYLVQVGARQRYPIDWLLTLLSVYALMKLWELSRDKRAVPSQLVEI